VFVKKHEKRKKVAPARPRLSCRMTNTPSEAGTVIAVNIKDVSTKSHGEHDVFIKRRLMPKVKVLPNACDRCINNEV